MMVQHKYLKNVTALALDTEKCVGCAMCAVVCPHGVFDTGKKKAQIIDKDSCMECGACALNCLAKAAKSMRVWDVLRRLSIVG